LVNFQLSKDAQDNIIKIFNNQSKLIPKDIGMNIGDGKIDEISDLNNEEAKRVFFKWYNTGAEYDYDNESKEALKKAGKFIVQQTMFIIMFLVLLFNCQ